MKYKLSEKIRILYYYEITIRHEWIEIFSNNPMLPEARLRNAYLVWRNEVAESELLTELIS